jgi:uncharacterized protein (TIRG00374 family)
VIIIILGLTGVLSLPGILQTRWQNMILNLGIGLFFLDFVFAGIDLTEVGDAFVNANYWMLIPSTIFVLIHLYFRTLRSQALLKPMGGAPFWPIFRALTISITANALLPARVGEFLRAYVLGRSTGLSKTGVFATVVVERILDGLTVLLVLVGVIILGINNPDLQKFGIAGGILYGGALLVLVMFMAKRHWADTLINKLLPDKLAEFSLKILDGFLSGLAILKSPGDWGRVLLWNICTWIPIPISFWFALQTFDFGAPIPWQAAVLMLPAMALALSVPGPPGGVGPVHAAAVLALDLTLPNAEAFEGAIRAASILIHISQFAPEVVAGIISFMIEGLSTKDISAGTQLRENESETV